MFQDKARFGRISDTRRCWCPKPMRPMAKAMVTQEYTYAYAAVSPLDGTLDTLILPWVNGSCMEIFLQEVSERHAQENILMVLDGADIQGWRYGAMVISLRLPTMETDCGNKAQLSEASRLREPHQRIEK